MHAELSISDNLLLAETPPTIRNSLFPVNASARSTASTMIEKAVSCNEKQISYRLFDLSSIKDLTELSNPEKETSFPLII
jgi:hypothetical protein